MVNYKLVKEYQFCKDRKFRFDFAILEEMLAIEIEGGLYTNGRHVRGSGYIKDMEKYNRAAIEGWTVLRYTPQQFRKFRYLIDVEKLIENRKKREGK